MKKIKGVVKNALVQQNRWIDKNTTITVKVIYSNGTIIPVNSEFKELKEGQFHIKLLTKRYGTPGLYTIQTTLVKNGKTYTTQDQYAWGLVSLNTQKSIYRPGEAANMTVVVLDNGGHPVCDATVSIGIIDPKQSLTTLSSENGITTGSECGLYNAQYNPAIVGNYTVNVSATSGSTRTDFSTFFLAQNNFAFDIVRTAQSKIDPINNPNLFNVKIDATSFVNATNVSIKESVPAAFNVTTDGIVQTLGDTKVITWNKNLSSNTTSVRYSYSVPLIFPQLYALGPVQITYGNQTFSEARQWFVANDPAVDTSTSAINTVTPINQAITVGSSGNNRLLIVGIDIRGNTGVSSVLQSSSSSSCVGGTTLTNVTSAAAHNVGNTRTEIWYFPNPPTGTNNICVAFTAAPARAVVGIISLKGVDQTSPISNSNSGTGTTVPSTSVTSSTNKLVISTAAQIGGSTLTVGSGQTSRWAQSVSTGAAGNRLAGEGSSASSSVGSTTMSWTGTSAAWSQSVVEINYIIKSVTESLSISDAVSKTMTKSVKDSLSITDSVVASKLKMKSVTESLSVIDSATKIRSVSLTDSLPVSEKMNNLVTKTLKELLPMTESVAVKNPVINIVESLSFTEQLVSSWCGNNTSSWNHTIC